MDRDFKGIWIPAEIWLDGRLSAVEKILLAEVDSFSKRDQSFFKSNDRLQEELGCSVATITRSFRKLQELQLIEKIGFDGRSRNFKSKLMVHKDQARSSRGQSTVVNKTKQVDHIDHAPSSLRPYSNTINSTGNNTFKDIVLPYDSEEFKNAWNEWKEYKKVQHKFTFKSSKTELASVHNLQKLANGIEKQAIAIIGQSIAQGWKGFFALKNNPRDTSKDRSKLEEYLRTGNIQGD